MQPPAGPPPPRQVEAYPPYLTPPPHTTADRVVKGWALAPPPWDGPWPSAPPVYDRHASGRPIHISYVYKFLLRRFLAKISAFKRYVTASGVIQASLRRFLAKISAPKRYVTASGVAALLYHHPHLTEVLFRDTVGALSELESLGCQHGGFSLQSLAVQNRRGANEDLERALMLNPAFRRLEVINTGSISWSLLTCHCIQYCIQKEELYCKCK